MIFSWLIHEKGKQTIKITGGDQNAERGNKMAEGQRSSAPANLVFCFVLYCTCTKRRCSQIKPELKIVIEDSLIYIYISKEVSS